MSPTALRSSRTALFTLVGVALAILAPGCGGDDGTTPDTNEQPSSLSTWVRPLGGSDWDSVHGVAVDGAGDIVVVGIFRGSVTFGDTTLTSAGGGDIFVAKLTPVGDLMWARRAGGSGDDAPWAIATDGSSNVVITGSFTGFGAAFGPTLLTNLGGEDAFVAKLSPDGDYVWATSAAGSQGERGSGIAVVPGNDVLVTGTFRGSLTVGNVTLTSSGGSDIFLVRLDSGGSVVSARSDGGDYDDFGSAIDTDASGAAFVTGGFNNSASFGDVLLSAETGLSSVFVVKYDPSGTPLWAQAGSCLSLNGASGTCVAVGADGDIAVAGLFEDTLAFPGKTLTSTGRFDYFIARYGSTGRLLWARSSGMSSGDWAYGLVDAGTRGWVVAGEFLRWQDLGGADSDTDVFWSIYSRGGTKVSTRTTTGALLNAASAAAITSSGELILTGTFDDTLVLPDTTVTTAGHMDGFVASIKGW